MRFGTGITQVPIYFSALRLQDISSPFLWSFLPSRLKILLLNWLAQVNMASAFLVGSDDIWFVFHAYFIPRDTNLLLFLSLIAKLCLLIKNILWFYLLNLWLMFFLGFGLCHDLLYCERLVPLHCMHGLCLFPWTYWMHWFVAVGNDASQEARPQGG